MSGPYPDRDNDLFRTANAAETFSEQVSDLRDLVPRFAVSIAGTVKTTGSGLRTVGLAILGALDKQAEAQERIAAALERLANAAEAQPEVVDFGAPPVGGASGPAV